MRRHGTIVMVVACALILVMMGIVPLNCIQKLSEGCPFSHKVKLQANPCPRDSLRSPGTTGVVILPTSAPVVPKPEPAQYAQADDSLSVKSNSLTETPPLRC